MAADRIIQHVNMGQLLTGRGNTRLVAVLGSCVGLAFLWPNGNRCALAHCVLPNAPPEEGGMGARYVTQAVPSLLTAMGVTAADRQDVDVVLAGGASMFGPGSAMLQVGRQNIVAALSTLQQFGLRVACSDLGGFTGRQLIVDCGMYTCFVKPIKPPASETSAPPQLLRR
jgi:chemotaxis protein CheD